MNSGFWPKEKFLLGMSNDCLRPSLDNVKGGRTMIGDAVFRCWRPSHGLPAGGTRQQDTDQALCPDQYSRCVLGCHFGSYQQRGARLVLPAVKIHFNSAA